MLVRRAQYLVTGPDLKFPYQTTHYFLNDTEAYQYLEKKCPVPIEIYRLSETEKEFTED